MDYLNGIYNAFCENKVFYTGHAKYEMENEDFGTIFDIEVFEAIAKGEILKEYLNDRPYPSFLIYGKSKKNRPLHIVCAYNKKEKTTFIITVYQPNPNLWINYRERRK